MIGVHTQLASIVCIGNCQTASPPKGLKAYHMQCQTRDTSTGKDPPTVVDVYVSTTFTELLAANRFWLIYWRISLFAYGTKRRDAVIG